MKRVIYLYFIIFINIFANETSNNKLLEKFNSGMFILIIVFAIVLIYLINLIIEKQKISNDLKENREKLQKIIDSVPVFIFHKDTSNNLIKVNQEFANAFGMTKQDIENRSLSEIIGNTKGNAMWDDEKEIINTKEPMLEIEEAIDTIYGKRWYSIDKVPYLNSKGEVIGIIGTARDITKRKILLEEVERAKEKAEKASESKSIFLANMSHEIRTPLNGIVVPADMIIESEVDTNIKKLARTIKTSSDLLLNIINDVLDMSKIEAGKLELDQEEVNINGLAKDIIKIFKNKAEKKKLELKYNFDERIDFSIIGDSTRIKQILMNLLGNAIKFTFTGYIALNIKLEEDLNDIAIIKFCVEDTGIGIEEEKKDFIFDMFMQISNRYKKDKIGTGLGLGISKKMVELMNGNIWIENKEKDGSIFCFQIPFIKSNLSIDSNEKELDKQNYDKLNLKILIVEDNNISIQVLTNILGKLNCEIEIAVNGSQAIDLSQKNDYDVILMDIQLPEINGIEATKRIRAIKKDAKIFAVTAYALTEEKNKIEKSGFDEFITKPISFEKIYNVLKKLR